VTEAELRTLGLGKDFGSTRALDRIDVEVRGGEIVGLLGPNGAGKTTTMKLLLGLLRPTRGRAEVLGLDCTTDTVRVKERLGYVPDEPSFYEFLTGRETIDFAAQMRGLGRDAVWAVVEPLVEALDFGAQLDLLVSGYSHGMKKKLALLTALLHRPKVLLFDEPTNGLDPPMAAAVRELFLRLAAEGAAILVSTHLLEMADRLCPRLLLLDRGRLVAEGSRQQIRARAGLAESESLEAAFLAIIAAKPEPGSPSIG
jgi:ABC-2 type transport system ATP-binding protein